MSLHAYLKAAESAESPRQVEYRLLGEVTRALMDASTRPHQDISGRMTALDWNRRVWTFLANDCAREDNGLPQEVRAGIISLGMWVGRHTSDVMQNGESLEPLIELNRTIMQGLASNVQGSA